MKARKEFIVSATVVLLGTLLPTDRVLHGGLLPFFERLLIFYLPVSVFLRCTATTVKVINGVTRIRRLFSPPDGELRPGDGRFFIVGAGIKSGAVLGTKVGLELALHYGRPLLLGDLADSVYADPWSASNNFRLAAPPPPSTVLGDAGAGAFVSHCHSTRPIVIPTGSSVGCVWFRRDPLRRLLSFYGYSLRAGEHQVRNASRYLRTISVEEGMRWVFHAYARRTIAEQMDGYDRNVRDRLNCTEIYMEDLERDFDSTMERLVRALGLFAPDEDVNRGLMAKLKKHDLATYVGVHPHASSMSKEVRDRAAAAVLADLEMSEFVKEQRGKMGRSFE